VRFIRPFLQLVFHLGYGGPLLMGVLDSSFLVLPFGNDFVVAGFVAQHPHGVAGYVLAAACGSTLGALLLALVARKLGAEGFTRLAGKRSFERLKKRIGEHAGVAVAVGGLAPPPFPFTTVIAGAAALGYPLRRVLVINFFARLVRFTLLALLAIRFGRQVIEVAQSEPFEWTMAGFIGLCVLASAFSIAHWLKRPRQG
jgi:membrane protein YqaA with SNARE-associated domain